MAKRSADAITFAGAVKALGGIAAVVTAILGLIAGLFTCLASLSRVCCKVGRASVSRTQPERRSAETAHCQESPDQTTLADRGRSAR